MYVKIDLTDYATIRNLVFSPQTDVTGDTVPINEFAVDIVTDDTIASGQYAELYDDMDNLWAKYWITYAERSGPDAVRIIARSDIALLDGVTLPAVMYSDAPVGDVLDATMVRQAGGGLVATIDYTLDSAFSSATLTGYCPEQSARERLQQICFVIGAYVKSFFYDEIEILPIDAAAAIIPIEKTFIEPKPTVAYRDHVTAVEITGFTFTEGTPATGDEYVEAGGTTYIVARQTYTLTNTDAPSTAADNIQRFDDVTLINADNVSGILARVAGYLFKRTSVQLDAIDNAEFIPGDAVNVYADPSTMFGGFIASCAFSFGLQARAQLNVTACVDIETATLTVLYKKGTRQLDHKEYALPVGYAYSIENPYIDISYGGHRYIMRPQTEAVEGTLTGDTTVTVQYDVALDLYKGTLYVVNVDEITVTTEGQDTVGVIT